MKKYFVPATKVVVVNVNSAICEPPTGDSPTSSSTIEAPLF